MFDGNVNAEWNQNILKNLHQENAEFKEYDDYKLLLEYDNWQMSDKSETFLEWMREC